MDPLSNVVPKQNYTGTSGVGQQKKNAFKTQSSDNTSQYGPAGEIDDVVLISENAQRKVSKDFVKSSGSIEISNNRIKYSLTKNNDLVIEIIDKKTNEVVRQIPPEELVKIKEILAKVLEQEIEEIEV